MRKHHLAYAALAALIVLVLIIIFAALHSSQRTYTAPVQNVGTTSSPTSSAVPAQPSHAVSSSGNSASYQYICGGKVFFSMTPSSDGHSLYIRPTIGTYPATSTLTYVAASSGARFEGNGIIFTAHGETAVLGEGESALRCSPVELPESAPYNFGD